MNGFLKPRILRFRHYFVNGLRPYRGCDGFYVTLAAATLLEKYYGLAKRRRRWPQELTWGVAFCMRPIWEGDSA